MSRICGIHRLPEISLTFSIDGKEVMKIGEEFKYQLRRVWLLDDNGEVGYWWHDFPVQLLEMDRDGLATYYNLMLKVFGEEALLRFMIDQDRAEVMALFRRAGNDSGRYGEDAKAIGRNNKERYIDAS